MTKYNIAVYAIALNEEKFVERWYSSISQANYILLADTGSSDNTVKIAQSLNIHVMDISVMPFRFDDARNIALSFLPKNIDFCVSLDLDEVMVDGWYEELQKVPSEATRIRYPFIHGWNPDGTPAKRHFVSKIHSRSGYRWVNPVHEVLSRYMGEEVLYEASIEIQHFPDKSKSRSGYLSLLEIACRENPGSSQLKFWLGREYLIHGRKQESLANLEEFVLKFPDAWGPEIAFAYMFLSDLDNEKTTEYLRKAIETAPYLRETWLKAADYYRTKERWVDCKFAALEASKLNHMPAIYLVDIPVWNGPKCFDLLALSCHFLGEHKSAIEFGERALKLAPDDLRLQNNLKAYLRTIAERD